MVSRILPGWSWEEGLDGPQCERLARRIIAELGARLGACAGRRLYAVTGHPRVPQDLQAALDGMARGGLDLRRVPRGKRPDAYMTADPDLFSRMLPAFFVLGPPEIAVLAFVKDAAPRYGGMGGLITEAAGRAGGLPGDAVCMDFDSGDLVRIA